MCSRGVGALAQEMVFLPLLGAGDIPQLRTLAGDILSLVAMTGEWRELKYSPATISRLWRKARPGAC
jgi:hypothetical protein